MGGCCATKEEQEVIVAIPVSPPPASPEGVSVADPFGMMSSRSPPRSPQPSTRTPRIPPRSPRPEHRSRMVGRLRTTMMPVDEDGCAAMSGGEGPAGLLQHGGAGAGGPFGIFGEERTLRLLVLPLGTLALTTAMTVQHTVRSLDSSPVLLFCSDALNDPKPESWLAFTVRWALWHLVTISLASFKCRVFPGQLRWVFILWACAAFVALYTGYRQTELPQALYGNLYKVHQLAALTLFILAWLETVTIWWANRVLHIVYAAAVPTIIVAFLLEGRFSFNTGIPYVYGHPEILLEWPIFVAQHIIAWYRFPVVSNAIANGTWKPWVCCFHPCCPSLVFTKDQLRCLCPPSDKEYNSVPEADHWMGLGLCQHPGRMCLRPNSLCPRPVVVHHVSLI